MKLSDFLASRSPRMRANAFAELIGVDPSMVVRWANEDTIPTPANMAKIASATGGLVTANDFVHQAAPVTNADFPAAAGAAASA